MKEQDTVEFVIKQCSSEFKLLILRATIELAAQALTSHLDTRRSQSRSRESSSYRSHVRTTAALSAHRGNKCSSHPPRQAQNHQSLSSVFFARWSALWLYPQASSLPDHRISIPAQPTASSAAALRVYCKLSPPAPSLTRRP